MQKGDEQFSRVKTRETHMFRILAAIAVALAKLAMGGLSFAWQAVMSPIRWIEGALFGPPTATPPRDLGAVLPSTDDLDTARFTAKAEASAKAAVADWPGTRQCQLYATTPAEDRYMIDLSQLSGPQQDWLTGLSERDLLVVANSDTKKIKRALDGENYVLTGIDSVGCDSSPKPTLEARILDFRSARGRKLNPIRAA
jgi:hypothetical protein